MRFRTAFLLLSLLPLAAPSAPAPTPTPVRLYRAATPAQTLRPDWELFLSRYASPDGAADAVMVKVELRRRGRRRSGELLLTVSATSQDGKSVSRRQALVELDRGQGEDTAVFRLDSPGCGPARVVAALFKAESPLARAEKILRFDCGD